MNKCTIILIATFFITQLLAQDITDGCDLPDDSNISYLHITTDGSVSKCSKDVHKLDVPMILII